MLTKIFNLLSGPKTLEVVNSKYNGEIKVVRDWSWGTLIIVKGLTQSGGIIANIWQNILKKITQEKPHVKSCLILGLGGGTCAKIVSQYWVGAEILGVDIDKKIVELGKKYLSLDKINIKVVIMDAAKFISNSPNLYDLIIVDLYNGDRYPEKFEQSGFIKEVKSHLSKNGIAIFNRLYGKNQKPKTIEFGKKLEKVFQKVNYIYPKANLAIVCYTQED